MLKKQARCNKIENISDLSQWKKELRKTASSGSSSGYDITKQASEILEDYCDPEKYLFSHISVVASVDTMDAPTKIGSGLLVDGCKINRPYLNYDLADYSEKYLNNNHDGWERGVLHKSYSTFIGAHNFCEHMQKLEHSKGRILDAVLRDVGDSNYCDILMATRKSHTDLIQDIRSKRINAVSMGCSVLHSQCTKCGNVAADESTQCSHIKSLLGQTFKNFRNQTKRIAELCGHRSIDPFGGVRFVEASWVSIPAFEGAVLRNFINVADISPEVFKKASQRMVDLDRGKLISPMKIAKSMFLGGLGHSILGKMAAEGFSEDDEFSEVAETPKEVEINPISELETEMVDLVVLNVKKKLKEMMVPSTPVAGSTSTMQNNDNMLRFGATSKLGVAFDVSDVESIYYRGLNMLSKCSMSNEQIVKFVRAYNILMGVRIPDWMYAMAMKFGPMGGLIDEIQYIVLCEKILRRKISSLESMQMLGLVKLLRQF